MDNKMINIDELFQQRMGNAEEAQRPGSWHKMRELLDEQMPVNQKPIAGTNWRRMLYVTAGLLLLSTITVGGYQAITAFRDNNISDDVMAKYAAYTPTSGAATAVINYADKSSNAQNDLNNNATTPNTSDDNNNQNAIVNVSSTKTGNKLTNNHPTQTETNGNKTQIKSNNNNNHNLLNNNNLNTVTDHATLASNNVSDNNTSGNKALDAQMKPVIDNISKIYNSNSANANNATVTNNTTASNNSNINTQTNSNTANNNSNDKNNTITFATASTNNTPKQKQVAETIKPNNNNDDGGVAKADTRIDSIRKIEMRQRVSSNGIVKTDTVNINKVAIELNDNDLVAANKPKVDDQPMPDNIVVPNAAALQMTTEDGEGVYKPLAKSDDDAKSKKNYYNANRFDEMVRNAKLKMRGVKFYPGIVAGANMSMSKKSLTGFQLGLKGDLSFGNRWSVLSELKYMQRFNGSKDLRDDYNTGLDSFVQNGNKIYTYDSVEHYFNFTTVSTIEMPIALKYNIKRFNVFGGVNLNYNLGINVDEVDRPYKVSRESGATTGTLNYGLLSGKPTITSSDFTSRFSVGYLFGMSYELSPAMQVDLRMTQPIWDNAKSSGSKAISKDIYNAPTIQFNMSYRFRQKPYKKFRN